MEGESKASAAGKVGRHFGIPLQRKQDTTAVFCLGFILFFVVVCFTFVWPSWNSKHTLAHTYNCTTWWWAPRWGDWKNAWCINTKILWETTKSATAQTWNLTVGWIVCVTVKVKLWGTALRPVREEETHWISAFISFDYIDLDRYELVYLHDVRYK